MRTQLSSFLLLVGAIAAQAPSSVEPTGLVQHFPTPIVASAGDGEHGGGLWAAGANYKASFHDGFTFVPVLGERFPRNLPFGWRTVAVRVGEQVLASGEGAMPRVVGQQCRFDLGAGVTEVYDVRADGVEQTFVLTGRPAGGDLVVVGAVTTELVAKPVAAGHTALRFGTADGQAIVEYGAATAIDANGLRFPMTTSWDGARIELRLDAATLAVAAFPLTVDPLTTTLPIDTGSTTAGAVVDVAIERNTGSTTRPMLVAYARQSSATDHDLFVVSASNGYGSVTPIFQDLATSWSTRRPQLAFVGAADQWVCAFERDFGSSTSVRCITVPGSANTIVTAVRLIGNPTGYQVARRPALGGTGSLSTVGTKALLVHQSDVTANNADTANSELFGRFLDLANGGFSAGAPFVVGTSVGTRYDRHNASINVENGGGNASWIVVCQQYDHQALTPNWRAAVWRIASNGAFYGPSLLFLPNNAHALVPKVVGLDGDYYMAVGRKANTGNATLDEFGSAIDVLKLVFPQNAANATFGPRRTVPISTVSVGSTRLGGIAMDTESRSHAAVVWQQVNFFALDSVGIARVGSTGQMVEQADLYRNSNRPGRSPAVCFDDDSDQFDCAFSVETPSSGVYARSFGYPVGARTETYGTSCGGTIDTNRAPRLGDSGFAVTLTGAVPGQIALVALSQIRSQFPLDLFGMPGCTLLVGIDNGNLIATEPALVLPDGTAKWGLPLPEWDNYSYQFTAQWFWFDPSAAGIGLAATAGLEVFVN